VDEPSVWRGAPAVQVASATCRRGPSHQAAFNRRAMIVYERAGLAETSRYRHHTNGALHDFVRMMRAGL